MAHTNLTMSVGDWLLLVVLSVCWGGSFFFTELAVHEIPPLLLALARCGIAAAFLLIYVRAVGLALPSDAATWRSLAVMAALNTVIPFALIFWGQTHIASGLASILNATAPLFAIVIAHFATSDDKFTVPRIVGLAVGFLGVVIVIGPDAMRDLGVNVLAQLAGIGGAFFYAASGVYGRRFQGKPPAVVAASVLLLGAVMLVPLAAFIDRPWTLPAPSAVALVAALGLGLLSTAFAFLIYFRVLARAGATNLQLVSFLAPVSAILLGVTFLGETLSLRQIVGMAAITIGLMAIDGRPHRALLRALRRSPKEA